MYCGELDYMGHDPSRIPIRFVWALRDFETLRKRKPFQNLVRRRTRGFWLREWCPPLIGGSFLPQVAAVKDLLA